VTRARRLPIALQQALLLGLGVVSVYAALVPLAPGYGLVPPDLLYCLVVAWTVRSPAAAPLWAVVLLGLFGDLMLSRPPGLGALGLMLAAEALRVRAARFRGAPFVLEWMAAIAAFAAMLAGIDLVLRGTLAQGAGLAALAAHVVATAIAYPLVVAGLAWGLGLRAPRGVRPGDRLGRVA
jgi:rod shape-determining protein MreD